MRELSQRFGAALDLLLPPACAGCGMHLKRGTGGRRLCPGCRTRIPSLPHPRCRRCHAPRGTGLPPERPCLECEPWPEVLTAARSAAVLAPPVDRLVHAFKYEGWEELADELASWMVPLLPLGDEPLVPVPTTAKRERERGYNQARILALALAEATRRRCVDGLVRRDGGGSQVALHPTERLSNVHGAFAPTVAERSRIAGKSVILVDDVLTTGATASAAATALESGGVTGVTVVTFARALPDPEG